MYLAALLLALLSTLAAAAQTPCRNVKPRGPFYLTAQYALPNRTIVAKLLNPDPADPDYKSWVLAVEKPGYDVNSIKRISLTPAVKGRLRFATQIPPHGPGGPIVEFSNMHLTQGEPLNFTAPIKPEHGQLGLVDTDIPGGGDAGCVITIYNGFRVRGFFLCNQNGKRVVNWERRVKEEKCVPMRLVAVNDPPY